MTGLLLTLVDAFLQLFDPNFKLRIVIDLLFHSFNTLRTERY